MKRQYKNYTDQEIIEHAKHVYSLAGLLKMLNLRCAGGNYANMKKHLQRLKVNTKHWTGQSWNKNQQSKDWSDYARAANLKPHLILQRGLRCESCKLTHWLKKTIVLEIHHIDGDRTNNKEQNLKLLCPNCHSITDNWRNKKR